MGDYPMKDNISDTLELQTCQFGIDNGVKTPEDMKNALTKLSLSIAVSKEQMLKGIHNH